MESTLTLSLLANLASIQDPSREKKEEISTDQKTQKVCLVCLKSEDSYWRSFQGDSVCNSCGLSLPRYQQCIENGRPFNVNVGLVDSKNYKEKSNLAEYLRKKVPDWDLVEENAENGKKFIRFKPGSNSISSKEDSRRSRSTKRKCPQDFVEFYSSGDEEEKTIPYSKKKKEKLAAKKK